MRARRSITNNPPLLIRLNHDVGKLPASVALGLPRPIARSLIMQRLAIPVGNFKTKPDAIINYDWLGHRPSSMNLNPQGSAEAKTHLKPKLKGKEAHLRMVGFLFGGE
jgi:hypothetical protein